MENTIKIRKNILQSIIGCVFIAGVTFYLASSFIIGLPLILISTFAYMFLKASYNKEITFKTQMRSLGKKIMVPVIGFGVALLIGVIILLITGYDPIEAYRALLYGGFYKNWHISVLNAVPLIFTGLSIAFAFKVGLFNIGAEGQYYIGAMAATFLGLKFNLPPVISIFLIFIIAGALAGLYNFIPAILKVKTGAHEVITTMMFAHIARYLSPLFIRAFGADTGAAQAYQTKEILSNNFLLRIREIIPSANYRLHIGILIAIFVALIVHYILYHTRFGFEVRAVGQNKDAAKVQGISAGKVIVLALLFSGFLAGLSGVNQVLGLDHQMFENLNANFGWNGISVALLASNSPIGVIFTSILWGALDAGGQYMSRTTNVSSAIVEIIKGIVLFLVVANYIYAYFGNRIKRIKKRKLEEKELKSN